MSARHTLVALVACSGGACFFDPEAVNHAPMAASGGATGSTTDTPTTDASTTDIMTTGQVASTEPMTATTDMVTTGQVSSTEPMTSTTTETTTAGITDGAPCENIKVTVKPSPLNAMLVLDKSGSMLKTWDHDTIPATPMVTRWYSLHAVVKQVLTVFDDRFNFGMNLYPSTDALPFYNLTACLVSPDVEVPVAPLNKDPIIMALPAQNSMTIEGATPTAAGLTAAFQHLKSLDPLVPRVVILITDGAANCSSKGLNDNNELFEVYDDNAPTIVDDAFKNHDIPTYVIGMATPNEVTSDVADGNPDGINPYDKLNELATLGGTARPGSEKFYNADNQSELAAALTDIVTAAQGCVIPLDSGPFLTDEILVKIGVMTVPKITDCDTKSGWMYTTAEPPYTGIVLCGGACEELKLAGAADVEYDCDAG